ncbi:MAG: DUF3306 domain-containing protein [Burkholderiales bacterium]|nr:DUF3306 domain-containing protein [Burkholderiales bacterium]
MAGHEPNFFQRWGRRAPAPDAAANVTPAPATALSAAAPPGEPPPPPTLADVAQLAHDSDYAPFIGRGVAPEVRNAALGRLFTDPRFNVMDGLDIYVDDYSQPDPLPAGMLQRMAQSLRLGLLDGGPEAAPPQAAPADPPAAQPLPPSDPTDEDPDLQLQPHDGAVGPGAAPGPDGLGTDPR